jgi:hypothetical protein
VSGDERRMPPAPAHEVPALTEEIWATRRWRRPIASAFRNSSSVSARVPAIRRTKCLETKRWMGRMAALRSIIRSAAPASLDGWLQPSIAGTGRRLLRS